MKKIIALTLMIFGISIAIFPHVMTYSQSKSQAGILEDYSSAMAHIGKKNDVVEVVTLDLSTNQVSHDIVLADTFNEVPDFEGQVKEKKRVYTRQERNSYISKAWPVEAMLVIEKIDLLLPVIEGAKADYLDVSVCSLDGTSKPWQAGNYAIAGHRSMTYGRHFNRLDELKIDDVFYLEDMVKEAFYYKVYQVMIVHESDVTVLDDQGFDEVTLITCDPIGQKNPEYRLVVKAKKMKPLN